MHLHIYTGANMELLCLNKKKTKQKLSSRKSRQMFCQKRKKKKKKRFVLVSVRTCAYKYQSYWDYKYTHTQRPQTKQWAWLRAWWRLAWLALNQAGRWSGAQWRPGHHYVWVASSPNEGVGELRQARRVGPNCHWGACLLWLIINYWAALSKASESAATSSVKRSCAPASCRDTGRVVLLTALGFGCPLVELELREQGAILLVLLHVWAHSISTVQL